MLVETKSKTLQPYDKAKFTQEIGCTTELIEKIDKISEKVKKRIFKNGKSKLEGNRERKYFGRSNNGKVIWVGTFFDPNTPKLHNHLLVGFCVYDFSNKNPPFPKESYIELKALSSIFSLYECYVERITIDGGYWYYFILDDIQNTKITKAYNEVKKILRKVLATRKSLKNENKSTPPKRHLGWIGKTIIVSIIPVFLAVLIFLTPKPFSSKQQIITENIITRHFPGQESYRSVCQGPTPEVFIKEGVIPSEKVIEKTINLNYYPFFALFVGLLLLIAEIVLIIFVFKDDSWLKSTKLDELYSIKKKLLDEDSDDLLGFNTESLTTEESQTEQSEKNKKTVKKETKESNRADLLKHYMTCVTEL